MNLQTARVTISRIAQKHSSPREDLLNVNQQSSILCSRHSCLLAAAMLRQALPIPKLEMQEGPLQETNEWYEQFTSA